MNQNVNKHTIKFNIKSEFQQQQKKDINKKITNKCE